MRENHYMCKIRKPDYSEHLPDLHVNLRHFIIAKFYVLFHLYKCRLVIGIIIKINMDFSHLP